MRQLFRHCATAFGLAALALTLTGSRAAAQQGYDNASRGYFVNFFGGGGGSGNDDIAQQGTALYPPAKGGPLVVNATGSPDSRAVGVGGLGIGREWSSWPIGDNGWGLLPAAEIEAYYLGTRQTAAGLNNPTNRLPEHKFNDSFGLNAGVLMADAVLSLKTPGSIFFPYAGAGLGAAYVGAHDAVSVQVSPAEAGINHFNSGTSSNCWGFATQAKTGLRVNLTEHLYLFTEYRFLFIHSTTYTFGSTVYPTHVATTPWTVHMGGMFDHLAIGGIGFQF
jgi:hypothetical protein